MSSDLTATANSVIDMASPPSHDAATIGLPGFELLEEIGRGGMGVVYRARQKSLNRIVAVKMILAGRGGPNGMERFRAEAEAVGRLQHVNIVQVYEIEEYEGQSFYALEYCETETSRKGSTASLSRLARPSSWCAT